MKCVYKKNNVELLEYRPLLFKPLYINFEPMRLIRRIRFLKEYLGNGHYKVYYLKVDDEYVGYCVVAPGGRRLKCSTEQDIVIGPYYINKQKRGNGYSELLVKLTLENCSYCYNYAFDWVEKNNIASRKTSENVGFTKYGELNVTPVLRRLVIVNCGNDIVFRFQRKK